MQPSQSSPRALLTALEVQELLHIDRSTVYRMAEDGRLPAIRVGRAWRFPTDQITAMLTGPVESATDRSSSAGPGSASVADAASGTVSFLPRAGTAQGPAAPARTEPPAPHLSTEAAQAVIDVASELLGVMMVVTDMHGHPITDVTNPCTWFSDHGGEPDVLSSCISEWRDLADHPDLTPRFQPGALGFECARAFVRHGSTLVGMVLAGGVSPSPSPTVDADLYHLDEAQRDRVLTTLPRIAAAISTVPPRAAATTPTTPQSAVPTKENR